MKKLIMLLLIVLIATQAYAGGKCLDEARYRAKKYESAGTRSRVGYGRHINTVPRWRNSIRETIEGKYKRPKYRNHAWCEYYHEASGEWRVDDRSVRWGKRGRHWNHAWPVEAYKEYKVYGYVAHDEPIPITPITAEDRSEWDEFKNRGKK